MQIEKRDLLVTRQEMVNERLGRDLKTYGTYVREYYSTTDGLDVLTIISFVPTAFIISFIAIVIEPIHLVGFMWAGVASFLVNMLLLQNYFTWPLLDYWKQKKHLIAEESEIISTDGKYGLALVNRAQRVLSLRVKQGIKEIGEAK